MADAFEPLSLPESSVKQRVAGTVLLLFTGLALWYAVRDVSTLWTHRRIIDAEPSLAIAVLAATPWLLLVSWRLVTGRLERADLMPPLAMMFFGLAAAAGGYWAVENGYLEFDARSIQVLLLLSAGSFATGLRRWISRRRKGATSAA